MEESDLTCQESGRFMTMVSTWVNNGFQFIESNGEEWVEGKMAIVY